MGQDAQVRLRFTGLGRGHWRATHKKLVFKVEPAPLFGGDRTTYHALVREGSREIARSPAVLRSGQAKKWCQSWVQVEGIRP